jgi:hypothetical protein
MTEIVKQVLNAKSETILSAGLNAMAKACEALTQQNKQLNLDIEGLKTKIKNLESRILANQEERE